MVKLEITTKIKKQLIGVGVVFLGMLYAAASEHVSLGIPYQQVLFNDVNICAVNSSIDVEQMAKEIRKELAVSSEDKLAIDYRISTEKENKFFTSLMTEQELEEVLREQLLKAAVNGGTRSYTVEIDGYSAAFSSLSELESLFTGVKDAADEKGAFCPVIKKQDGHVKGIMTAFLEPKASASQEIALFKNFSLYAGTNNILLSKYFMVLSFL